jgi:hypothetical protein
MRIIALDADIAFRPVPMDAGLSIRQKEQQKNVLFAFIAWKKVFNRHVSKFVPQRPELSAI